MVLSLLMAQLKLSLVSLAGQFHPKKKKVSSGARYRSDRPEHSDIGSHADTLTRKTSTETIELTLRVGERRGQKAQRGNWNRFKTELQRAELRFGLVSTGSRRFLEKLFVYEGGGRLDLRSEKISKVLVSDIVCRI